MYGVLALVVWAVLRRSVVRGLRDCAPVLGGTAVALVFHLASSGGSGSTGNALSLNFAEIGRVWVQQMAASLPFLNPLMLGEDPGVITGGDKIWPLALGLAAGLLLCFAVPLVKPSPRALGGLGGAGPFAVGGPRPAAGLF